MSPHFQLVTEWLVKSHRDLFGTILTKEEADFVWAIAVSIFPLGGMFGALLSGWLGDKVGRRGGLFYNNIFAFAAAAFMALAKAAGVYYMMIIGRFLIGLNCGEFNFTLNIKQSKNCYRMAPGNPPISLQSVSAHRNHAPLNNLHFSSFCSQISLIFFILLLLQY